MAAALHMYNKLLPGKKRLLGEDFWCRGRVDGIAIVCSTKAEGLSRSSFYTSHKYIGECREFFSRSCSFSNTALFFADFADIFLISAGLKLPIKPRSVASPISSRRENQQFHRVV